MRERYIPLIQRVGKGSLTVAARRTRTDENKTVPVEDYEHIGAKRTNNPPAGLAHLDRDKTPTRTVKYEYDPHLDPVLTWAGKAERQTVEVPAPPFTCMRSFLRRRSSDLSASNGSSSRCSMSVPLTQLLPLSSISMT